MKSKLKQSPQYVIVCGNDPNYKGMNVYLGNLNPKTGRKVHWVDDIRDARKFYDPHKAKAICSALDTPKGHLDPEVRSYLKKGEPEASAEERVHILLTVNQIQRQLSAMLDKLDEIVNYIDSDHAEDDDEEADEEEEADDEPEEDDDEHYNRPENC